MDLRTALRRIVVLACPALLAGLVLGPVAASAAQSNLIASARGGHYWFDFCEDQPDGTPLPPDPRSLVTPTFDKAVAFNVAWHACMDRQPATCGELRALQAAGGRLLRGNGHPEAGWQFSGDHPSGLFGISAGQYNLLWLRWGLLARPADFDQLLAERYGTPLSAQRNPYPLPGEDPNLTDGGSGPAADGPDPDPQRRRHAGAATSASPARSVTAGRSARRRTDRASARSSATTGSPT